MSHRPRPHPQCLLPVIMTVPALVVACSVIATDSPDETSHGPRIGTYDNRAIAVAFAASRFNDMSERMGEYEKAKAAGDAARMKELEAWGQARQRRLHRQGFGRVPVDDLLEHVEDQLANVARQTGVDAITWHCAYARPDVVTVDVTSEIVALFDPSAKTLRTIRQLRGREPLDLDEIDRHHDH
ncbi:MAG: hypothetical protein CMJ18_05495 [Phycisphaeraceae bacterium]|nr:hypothetical protein [Phycisphaeraceae bacterium]